MVERSSHGPDLVIAGAARSGTSTLAAQLRAHPAIDPGTTKEPSFFSSEYERGSDWYDGQFESRTHGLIRMDASTSYTYPQHQDALKRLTAMSPDAVVVYLVRDPLARAVSHYLLRRYTLRIEDGLTFGAALRTDSFYAEVSDYSRWLPLLRDSFGESQMLVAPFEAIRRSSHGVACIVCDRLGLDPPPDAAVAAAAHRNSVVEFRGDRVRRAVRTVRRSPVYPRVRAVLGTSRIRRLRSALVRPVEIPTVAQALDSCDSAQLTELRLLEMRAVAAVREDLAYQDVRYGMDWKSLWP